MRFNGRIRFGILALISFAAVALAWWISIRGTGSPVPDLYDLLRLLAAWGVAALILQYILASRVHWFEGGYGQDRMLDHHRWLGRAAVGLLVGHAALVTYTGLRLGDGILLDPGRLLGMLALLLLFATASTASLHKSLGLRYGTWKGIHLANYLVLPVAAVHFFNVAIVDSALLYPYAALAAGFSALVVHRLWGIARMHRNPYRVTAVIPEAKDIWTLRFSGPTVSHLPGQYLHVHLLRDGRREESHPFTISSKPGAEHLSITPKASGDFTATIGQTSVGDGALVDAPYGIFSYCNHDDKGKAVFIAGGIGITPFMSMLRYMRDHDRDRDVLLLWANRSRDYLCFEEELAEMAADLPGFQRILFMSDDPGWQGEKGHIDAERIRRYAGDLAERRFYVCGPPPMRRSILAILRSLGVPGNRIHYEVFEL